MGWAFWRRKEKPAEPERAKPLPGKRVVPLDRTEEIARAAKLRQYIVGRMNLPAAAVGWPLDRLRGELEKRRAEHYYVSAVAKLGELEVLES